MLMRFCTTNPCVIKSFSVWTRTPPLATACTVGVCCHSSVFIILVDQANAATDATAAPAAVAASATELNEACSC